MAKCFMWTLLSISLLVIQIKRFRDEFIEKLFSDHYLVFTAKRNMATIRFLDRIVREIEVEVASQIKLKKEFITLLHPQPVFLQLL